MNFTEFSESWQIQKNIYSWLLGYYLSLDIHIPCNRITTSVCTYCHESHWIDTLPRRCGNKNFFFPTSSRNVSIARHTAYLVTISLLDLSQFIKYSKKIWGKSIDSYSKNHSWRNGGWACFKPSLTDVVKMSLELTSLNFNCLSDTLSSESQPSATESGHWRWYRIISDVYMFRLQQRQGKLEKGHMSFSFNYDLINLLKH